MEDFVSSQKTVEKNENSFRAFGRTLKNRLQHKAGSRRNVSRKITASAVLLSILFLAIPFTQFTQVGLARRSIEPQGGLSQEDTDAINVLAAFNIGTPTSAVHSIAPNTLPSGVVVATQIGVDPAFPPLFGRAFRRS